MYAMREIKGILFDEQTIAAKVRELAVQVSRDYAGKELVLVAILKGAVVFTADLMRLITVPLTLDFVCALSYGAGTESSRTIIIKQDLDKDIREKHVLLVDTIVDSGETLAFLIEKLSQRHPASLKTAALLDKPSRRTIPVTIDYRGFEIPDTFVVGYGMDCGEQYRNLPVIAAMETQGS